MRILLIVLGLSLFACASAGGGAGAGTVPADAGPTTSIHRMGTGLDVTAANDAVAVGTDLPAPVERVWGALPYAYQALGIPLTQQDAATHTLGNANYRPPRIWNGQRLSAYLDCGMTGASGTPGADAYTVRMTVRSQVLPTAGGSRVQTRVDAAARNMDGTGSADIHCTSTGKLESALAAAVATNLGS